MKQLTIFLISFLSAITIFAQQKTSDVTVTVEGNKSLQLTIDEKNYSIAGGSVIGNKTTLLINDLVKGQHTFQVTRTDPNRNRAVKVSTIFMLRPRYDMDININEDGSIELIEIRKTGISDGQAPMTNTNFSALLRTVRAQRSTAGKNTLISNAFNKPANYFTTYQVRQLIQTVPSESDRLSLSKLSYQKITDQSNFYNLYDLLKSQASRNELEDYVNNYDEYGNEPVAMSDADYNTLYQTIRQQWPVSTQITSITNAFNNTNYSFTAYQASRLIQIVSGDNNRLPLAKLSYRSVTDRDNFSQVVNILSTQYSRDELNAYVNNYGDGGAADIPMTDASFNTLYQDIRNQWPASTQVNSLTSAFNNTYNHFSAYQASRLIQIVSGDNNRLPLAKLSYRSITDRNNFSQVVNILSTQYSRDELTAYVNNYGNGGTTDVPMNDALFNTLYQDIRNQWPVSTQYNSIASAFNNTAHHFSAYQASKLIQIVSGDNNRLPLAKLSYRSITDRNNFNQVVNLLSSQYNRDELTAYVNSYGSGGNADLPMTDALFNTLYQDIRNQWPVSTQYNSLTGAFNNTANHFSAYQASQLIQIVSGDNNRLPLAKLSYRTVTDRNNFNQVVNLLTSQYNRDELTAFVNNYGDGGTTGAAMTDANFNTLYQDIKNQWPASSQVNSLTTAFNNTNNYFTSYQASRLIQLVTGDNSRLPLAKLAYRSITDRNNFSQVVNLLSYQSSRDELTNYINGYSGGTSTRVAMTDSDFNALYQDIQMQFLPGAKMLALTNAFNNTSYYFTTAQAKLLIPMVSLESNRLQLAKLSYRTITDRNNFSQVYELLDNQADRDELDAYVKAYTE